MREERTPPRLLLQQPDSAETTGGSLPANWQGQAAARVGYLAGVATVVGAIAGVLAFFRQANVGESLELERRWTHTDAARWWGATLDAEGQPDAASLPFAPTVAVEKS